MFFFFFALRSLGSDGHWPLIIGDWSRCTTRGRGKLLIPVVVTNLALVLHGERSLECTKCRIIPAPRHGVQHCVKGRKGEREESLLHTASSSLQAWIVDNTWLNAVLWEE